MSTNKNYELKTNKDGTDNPKYIDLLDEDKSIAGQKFVCLSFISPENIIKDKNQYFFQKFVEQWDMTKSLEKYTQFTQFLIFKYKLDQNSIQDDLKEFLKSESSDLANASISDEYKSFLDVHEEKLSNEFNETYNYKTNTRGIKVRGSYPSQTEAELRCKMLREVDPNHDVYVGEVGMWMPFHPDAYRTGKIEYLEEELNELMHEKNKNEETAKQEFDKRVKESKMRAIEENVRKASETGNVLTQTINKDGELVDVKSLDDESVLDNEIVSANMRKELFEGEEIIRDKNNDHGLGVILENHKLENIDN